MIRKTLCAFAALFVAGAVLPGAEAHETIISKDGLARAGFAPSAVINAGGPVIKSGSPISAQQTQTLVIKGTGFGSQPGFNGNSPYLEILDVTASWAAGSNSGQNDLVNVDVKSWNDKKIVIDGFTGDYGGQGGQWVLSDGDVVLIYIGNPQTGITVTGWSYDAAPSVCLAVVGSENNCMGPH